MDYVDSDCSAHGGGTVLIRNALIAAAGVLVATLLVVTPAGALPANGTTSTTNGAIIAAWWAQIQPDYKTLGTDVVAVGTAVGDVPSLNGALTGVNAACKKVVTDVATLQKLRPAPDRRVNARWQAALKLYGQGASACVKGTATKTTKLIGKAGHDFKKGGTNLRSVTTRVKKLTTTGT